MRWLIRNERAAILLITMITITGVLTFGLASMYVAATKARQVSEQKKAREALYVAEAGLNYGATLAKQGDWDGFYDELNSGLSAELVTIGSETYTLRLWIDTTSLTTKKKYRVWIADNYDDDWTSGSPSSFCIMPLPDGTSSIDGTFRFAEIFSLGRAWASDDDDDSSTCPDSGDGTLDVDLAIIIIAKGWVENNDGDVESTAFVKGLYKLAPTGEANFTILTEGSIDLGGNATLTGNSQCMHTNGDLTITGSSATCSGAATASGTVGGSGSMTDISTGEATGIQIAALATIFPFSADISKDKVLAAEDPATPLTYDADSEPIVDGSSLRVPSVGTDCVEISKSGGTYTVTSPSPGAHAVCRSEGGNTNAGGVFYFDGPVVVNVSSDWAAAILSTGRITLSTNDSITGSSDLAGVAMVSDQDIVYTGNATVGGPGNYLGIFAGSNIEFQGGGNRTIYGNIVAGEGSVTNVMDGTLTIDYDSSLPAAGTILVGQIISYIKMF